MAVTQFRDGAAVDSCRPKIGKKLGGNNNDCSSPTNDTHIAQVHDVAVTQFRNLEPFVIPEIIHSPLPRLNFWKHVLVPEDNTFPTIYAFIVKVPIEYTL